jgi:hypothetical protein
MAPEQGGDSVGSPLLGPVESPLSKLPLRPRIRRIAPLARMESVDKSESGIRALFGFLSAFSKVLCVSVVTRSVICAVCEVCG